MMTGARSEETGQDYEHLEVLLAKFQQFKLRVQSGEEKYKVCESLAKRLETADCSAEIKKIQVRGEIIKSVCFSLKISGSDNQ